MALSEIEQHQLIKLAGDTCQSRNHSVCVELAKAEFELVDNGIEFYHSCFKLDSSQADYRYLVAKIVCLDTQWHLLVAHRDPYEMFEGWHAYPARLHANESSLGNPLHRLMKEVEQDPQGLIW
ncbi:DUF3024 domain-containing protein [Vibrio rarus]|uniref:DUF3024 domain-containing protein n=1 Tax=Vibrio rarus TaxID=413403 RepID=UPI0021C36CB7|nr:DUF3024 domain-containing protein [Vibrio rarus]